jgi:hypothetical protein
MNLWLQNTRTRSRSGQITFQKGTGSTADRQYETAAFYFFSVTNFYRIRKNSFSFQACDDGGRVIRGNFNAGHDFGNAQLHEDGGKALIAGLKTF